MSKMVDYRTFKNFDEAHRQLLRQGFEPKGQDGCLNHLYATPDGKSHAKAYSSWDGYEVQFS